MRARGVATTLVAVSRAMDRERTARAAYILAAVTVLVAACGATAQQQHVARQSPGDVITSAMNAANGGRYGDADRLLTDGARRVEAQDGGSAFVWDHTTRGRQISRVAIVSQHVEGDAAQVQFALSYQDGCSAEGRATLARSPVTGWLIGAFSTDPSQPGCGR